MRWYGVVMLPLLIAALLPYVRAQTLDTEPSASETQAFDEILSPVMTVYKLVKYAAAVVGALALAIAGIMYMFSANDVHRRDQSKLWIGYVFVGLVVIWATPMLIGLLT